MADKSPVGYLPSGSPEAIEANRAYQEALARLNESLDMRKNRTFDPRWAAVTKAFSTPGQTGSGAETIGRVMGALGEAETGMALEEQNIAKNQLDVAAQGIQLQKQKENERTYRQMMGLEPFAGALPPAAPAGPSGGALPSAVGPQGSPAPTGGVTAPRQFGIQIAPAQPSLTKNQFLAGAQAEGISPFEALKQWDEIERKSFETKDGGMLDIRSKIFYPFPGAGTEERQVPLPDGSTGTIKFPKYIANILDDANLRGDYETFNSVLRQWINYGRSISAATQGASPNIAAAPGAAPTPATLPTPATPPAGAPSAKASTAPGRIQTVEEQQTEQRKQDIKMEGEKTAAKGLNEANVEFYKKSANNFENSTDLMSAAKRMIEIIDAQPDAFRLLSDPGIAKAVGRAAEEGISFGRFNVSLPVGTLFGGSLSKNQLNALNLYAQQLAIAKQANRAMVRIPGEGETSNLETNLSNAVLDIKNATPEALKFINEFTILRARNAELRHQKMEELIANGVPLISIRSHPEMMAVRNAYKNSLDSLAERSAQFLKGDKKTSGAAQKAQKKQSSELSSRIDEALRN
jgi:hypothetical protein